MNQEQSTNRMLLSVARAEAKIASRQLSPEAQANLSSTFDLTLDDYCRFQELKTLACASGQLTLEEALTTYGYLGNTVEHFNQQPLAVKVACTELLAELLTN